MANTKISGLSSASTPLSGSEIVPLNQSGTTDSVSVANLTAGRAVSGLSFSAATIGAPSSTNLSIQANGTTYITVLGAGTNNGFVGIATSSPVALLDVNNTSGGTSGGIRIYATDQAYARLNIQNANGQAWHLVAGNPGASNTGFAIYDATNSATRAYFDASGNITFNSGNLVQGTSGKGINFTANTPASGMTSQNLNWYEEGTWTATDQSGASLTFTANRTATYIRIGSQVTAWFDITYPANASGAAAVISLPIKNGPTHDASVCWGYITYATAITGDIARNQSYFYPSTLGGANVTNAALSGVRMIGTAIYTTI